MANGKKHEPTAAPRWARRVIGLARRIFVQLRIYHFLYRWGAWILAGLPSSRWLNRVRGCFLSLFLNGSCHGLIVNHGFYIPKPWLVTVGNHVAFNCHVMIMASKEAPISFGDYTLVGPLCVFRSADHRFDDLGAPIQQQGHSRAPIVVKEDCWIASSVTVTKGVTIGPGSVIGANSVVTRDVPAYSVAAGVPARVIRRRGRSSSTATDRALETV